MKLQEFTLIFIFRSGCIWYVTAPPTGSHMLTKSKKMYQKTFPELEPRV